MDIKTFKQNNPQFEKYSDEETTQMVFTNFVEPKGVDFDTFKTKFLGQTSQTPEEQSTLGDFGTSFSRGLDEAKKAIAYVNPFQDEGDVADITQEQRSKLPSPEEMEFMRTVDEGTASDVVKQVIKNPKGVAQGLTTSLGAMTPGAAITVGANVAMQVIPQFKLIPPVAKKAITGAILGGTEGGLEAVGTILDTYEEFGYDVGDEEQLKEAINNPVLNEYAKEQGFKRGIPIGAMSTIGGALAGSFVKQGVGFGEQLGRFGLETATQAGTGMGGEALAQLSKDGEITSTGAIVAEGLFEGVMAAPQAVAMSVIEGKNVFQGNRDPLKVIAGKSPDEIKSTVQDIEKDFSTVDEIEAKEIDSQLFPQVNPLEENVDDTPSIALIKQVQTSPESLSNPVTTPVDLSLKKAKAENTTAIESVLNSEDMNPFLKEMSASDIVKTVIPPQMLPMSVNKQRLNKIKPQKIYDTQGNPYDVEFVGTDEKTGVKLAKLPDGKIQRVEDTFSDVSPKDTKNYITQSTAKGKGFNPYVDVKQAKETLPFIREEMSFIMRKGDNRTPEDIKRFNTLQRDKTALERAVKPVKTKNPEVKASGVSQNVNGTIYPPRTQRLYDVPDLNIPTTWNKILTGGQNIFSLPLTDKGQKRYKDIIPVMEARVRQIGGKNIKFAASDSFLMSEIDDPELLSSTDKAKAEFLRGVQIGNVVHVAMDINDSAWLSQNETLLHEMYHIVKDEFDVISAKDKQILKRAEPQIKKLLVEDFGLASVDVDNMQKMMGSELEATLFGLMLQDSEVIKLPNPVRNVFNKIRNFLEKLGNSLRGLGFRSFQDIFENISEGKYANTIDVMTDVARQKQLARLQKVNSTFKQNQVDHALEELSRDVPYPDIEEFNSARTPNEILSVFSKAGLWLGTGMHLGRQGIEFAELAAHQKVKNQLKSQMLKRYGKFLEEMLGKTLPRKDRQAENDLFMKASSLVDYMKRTGQSYVKNQDGLYYYKALDGSTKVMSSEVSRKVSQIENFFNMIVSDGLVTMRSVLPQYNLSTTSSLSDIQSVIDLNPDKFSPQKLVDLQSLYNQLSEMDGVLRSKKAYVPWSRSGDLAIAVNSTTEKDPTTSKPKLVGLFTFDNSVLGPSKKEVLKKIEDLKAQYGEGYKVSNSFVLTMNTLEQQMGKDFLTSEFYANLVSQEKGEEFRKLATQAHKDRAHKGLMKHFLEPKMIDGYSQEWDKVMVDFAMGMATNLSNVKYSANEQALISAIEATPPQDKTKRKALEKYIDYNFRSSEGDMAYMRMFNYYFALGGSVATAFLNPLVMLTSVPSGMTLGRGNIVVNLFESMKALKDTIAHVKNLKQALDDTHMENLVKKGKLTQNEVNLIQRVARDGVLQPSLSEDYIGQEMAGFRASGDGLSRNMKVGFNKMLEILSVPTQMTENMARTATVLATYRMLSKSDQYLNNYSKAFENDKVWNAFYGMNQRDGSLEELKTLLAEFTVDYVHGNYAKEGRGELQRGWWGSTFLPFATFPQNQLEFTLDAFANKGPQGKAVALYTVSSYILLAGLVGIPMWDLLKEFYNIYSKVFNLKPAELEKDIYELVIEAGIEPELALAGISGGGLRYFFDLDLGSRMAGINSPLADFMMSIMNGEDVRNITGIAGSVGKSASNLLTGEGTLASESMNLLPVAIRNFARAYVANTQGVSTGTGNRLVNPEDFQTVESLFMALGFGSAEVKTMRDKLYWETFEKSEGTMGKTRFVNEYAKLTEKLRKEKDQNKRMEIRMERRKVKQEAREWAKENDPSYKNPVGWWDGFNNSVQTRVQQRANPEDSLNLRKWQDPSKFKGMAETVD